MLYQNNKPTKVTSVVISTQHSKDLNQKQVKDLVLPYIKNSIPERYVKDLDSKEIYINPTGQFIIGGPDGDTGLTGKIMDFMRCGPARRGAFSADPLKDDSGLCARYLSKILYQQVFLKILIQLSYRSFKTLIYFYKLSNGDEDSGK